MPFINMTEPNTLWIGAAEALALLKVRPQTLYANVSRGKVRARPDKADPRRSRYHREDVLRLARAQRGRRPVAAVASGTLAWGEPVLPSAVSTVAEGRLLYRGRPAAELAAQAELEEVAAWLWQGPLLQSPGPVPRAPRRPSTGEPMARALVALARRAAADLPTLHRGAAALRADASQAFHALAEALVGEPAVPGEPVSRRLARTWGQPQAAGLLRRALVLLADHELNASTFAARVAVSTGASLSAGLLAGLATLGGPLHGRAGQGVAALVRLAAEQGAEAAVRQALATGHGLPGFGHPLYPQGDERARLLLASFRPPAVFSRLARFGEELQGEKPNIDFALAALSHAQGLPAHAPLTLFALARGVGWLAHGLEQAEAASGPIRPRARYVGP